MTCLLTVCTWVLLPPETPPVYPIPSVCLRAEAPTCRNNSDNLILCPHRQRRGWGQSLGEVVGSGVTDVETQGPCGVVVLPRPPPVTTYV